VADTEGNTAKALCMGICIHKGLAVFMQVSNVAFWVGRVVSRLGLVCSAINIYVLPLIRSYNYSIVP
jgi:hypothetical protein